MPTDYAVVGAEVEEPSHYYSYTDTELKIWTKDEDNNWVASETYQAPGLPLEPAKEEALQPLTVETIGRIMVEMSENPGMLPKDVYIRERLVRASLMFHYHPDTAPGEAAPGAEKIAGILENTVVRIEYESRLDLGGQPDKNERILVVPADGTLKKRKDALEGTDPGTNPPPLTYPLDEKLMLSSMRDKITGYVEGFNPADEIKGDWTDALKAALQTHITKQIKSDLFIMDGGEPDPKDTKNQILSDPVRAFHRSVGIYATNMCR